MIKIAMIGAGSIGFTRGLLRDILTVPEFADTEFRFMDISAQNLSMAATLCTKTITENGLPARFTVHVIDVPDRAASYEFYSTALYQKALNKS